MRPSGVFLPLFSPQPIFPNHTRKSWRAGFQEGRDREDAGGLAGPNTLRLGVWLMMFGNYLRV